MADLSKVKLNGTIYNLKDAEARNGLPYVIECSYTPAEDEDPAYYTLDVNFSDLYDILEENERDVLLKCTNTEDAQGPIVVIGRLLSHNIYIADVGESNGISICFAMSALDDREDATSIVNGYFEEGDSELIVYPYSSLTDIYSTLNEKVSQDFIPNFIGNTGWDDSNFEINIIDNTGDFSLNKFLVQVIPETQDVNATWVFNVRDFDGTNNSYTYNKSVLKLADIYDKKITGPSSIEQGLYLVEKTEGVGVGVSFTFRPFLTSEHVNVILTNNYYTQDEIDDMLDIPLASSENDGLMSAQDKEFLDSLNPNIEATLTNINSSEFQIINAKQSNALNMVLTAEPIIEQQIRTSNLLDVNVFTPGFYIGSNGQLASNANDHVGDFIPVSPGDDIYYTGIIGPTNSSSINRRLHVYKADKTWIKQISFAASLRVGQSWSTHGAVPSNGAYIRVSWGVEDTNVMLSVGAPDKYWPYYITPFDTISEATFAVGSTTDREDATEYSVTVPVAAGTQYGFSYNPILGKLYSSTGHISSYNGETLPGVWWSDRDTYTEGTSPSTGAEVIYRLADEDIDEYDFTPMSIPLGQYVNYFFVDGGQLKELSYYAQTLAINHLTINDGVSFGSTNILESDVIAWNNAANAIDGKANIDSPEFTGSPMAPNASIGTNSIRIANTAYVQTKMSNLAPFEAAAKASTNYSVGDYVYIASQGKLFKVTAATASGANFVVGTNITETTVADELKALQAAIAAIQT